MINDFDFICMDLWGTLFLETPSYKKKVLNAKVDAFMAYFNNINKDQLKLAMAKDKKMASKESSLGYNVCYLQRVYRILKQLNIEASKKQCLAIYEEFERQVADIYPDVNNELLAYLKIINQKIILCSNSGFTCSKIVKEIIYKLGLNNIFYKMYFSDENKKTKANPEFYLNIVKNENSSPNKFLIVGDNINYDVNIPNGLGMKGLEISEFISELTLSHIKENYLRHDDYQLLSVVTNKNLVYLNKRTNEVIKFFKRFPTGQQRFKRETDFYKLTKNYNIKIPKMLGTEKFKNDIIFASIKYEFCSNKSTKENLKNAFKTLEQTEFLELLKNYVFRIINLLKEYFDINRSVKKIKFRQYDRTIYMYKRGLSVYASKIKKLVPHLKDQVDHLMKCYKELENLTCNAEIGLTNGDFTLRDILIDSDTIYAIDWEQHRYAPVELDVASILCSLFNAFYSIQNIDEILIGIIYSLLPNINSKLLAYFCINRFIAVACTDYKIIKNENYEFYYKFLLKLLGGYYETFKPSNI